MFSQKTCCSVAVLVKTSQYPLKKVCKTPIKSHRHICSPKNLLWTMIARTNKTYFLRDTLNMWHMQARQKVLGQNVDLGLVSSCCARANQTQVNTSSPQIFCRRWSHTSLTKYFGGKMLTWYNRLLWATGYVLAHIGLLCSKNSQNAST